MCGASSDYRRRRPLNRILQLSEVNMASHLPSCLLSQGTRVRRESCSSIIFVVFGGRGYATALTMHVTDNWPIVTPSPAESAIKYVRGSESLPLLVYNAFLDSASTNNEVHVLRVSRADGEGDHVIGGEHFLVDVVSEAGQRKYLPLQARATPLPRPCIAGDAACRARDSMHSPRPCPT
ncbi:hypothetical protein EDB92DRAFT_1862762 [Lactarius akahatsu]|uniref:Uncharacterized protein n=1 Tax=Lactarius akahatsu TaxID=416441 RepID=A0AAD4LJR1_9AGAM|nr:hypothetical protein EDB92DRAFT_1862762 [Lactarius akahatsu]